MNATCVRTKRPHVSWLVPMLFLIACDDDPPVDEGIIQRCSAEVTLKSSSSLFILGTETDKFGLQFGVCANPDTPAQEVLDECGQECADHFAGIADGSLFVGVKCNTDANDGSTGSPGNCKAGGGASASLTLVSADCKVVGGPEKTGSHCDEADRIYQPNTFGQFGSGLTLQSGVAVTVMGEGGSTTPQGQVSYSVFPRTAESIACTSGQCGIALHQMELTAPSFEIDGTEISALELHLVGQANGSWDSSSTAFVIPAEQFRVQAQFRIEGKVGSKLLSASNDVTGFVNPWTGRIDFAPIAFGGDDFAATLDVHAEAFAWPPEVAIQEEQPPIECDADRSGPFNGSVVVLDPDNDLKQVAWASIGTNGALELVGEGEVASFRLPLGRNTVNVFAVDSRGGHGLDFVEVPVVDTVGPTLTTTGTQVETCQPGLQVVEVPLPIVEDACTPASVSLVGAVVEWNGVQLPQPVPIEGNTASLEPGDYTIEWVAHDEAGNRTEHRQPFALVSRPALFATSELALGDRARVEFAEGGLATVANAGPLGTLVGGSAQVGTVLSASTVELRNGAYVDGFVRSGGTVILPVDYTITTDTVVSGMAPALPAVESVSASSDGTTGVVVENDDVGGVTLLPGDYADVLVRARGYLNLSAGVYHFRSWIVEPDAGLRVLPGGPVEVFVEDDVLFYDRVVWDPIPAVGGLSVKAGGDTVQLESNFYGRVVAPDAELTMGADGSRSYVGEYQADTIVVRPDALVVQPRSACVPSESFPEQPGSPEPLPGDNECTASNTLDLGPSNSFPTIVVQDLKCLRVAAAQLSVGWSPASVGFQIQPNDGQPMNGSVEFNGSGPSALSGWSAQLAVPFPGATSPIIVKLRTSSPRSFTVNWWLSG